MSRVSINTVVVVHRAACGVVERGLHVEVGRVVCVFASVRVEAVVEHGVEESVGPGRIVDLRRELGRRWRREMRRREMVNIVRMSRRIRVDEIVHVVVVVALNGRRDVRRRDWPLWWRRWLICGLLRYRRWRSLLIKAGFDWRRRRYGLRRRWKRGLLVLVLVLIRVRTELGLHLIHWSSELFLGVLWIQVLIVGVVVVVEVLARCVHVGAVLVRV